MTMKPIDAFTVKQWQDNGTALFIDVREPDEYAIEYIADAQLQPLGSISRADIPTTDKKIILYCKAGMRSAHAGQKILMEDNSLELYNLTGGIEAWKRAGLPLRQGEEERSLQR